MSVYEDAPLLDPSAPRSNSSMRKIQRVTYSASSHVQVMFQMYGSVLPQVLPFCLTNVVWTIAISLLRTRNVADVTFQSFTGHSFMGILVSFLVVSRCNISYNRFMEMRRHLGEAYRSCRELIQYTCVYTMSCQSKEAQVWRQEVAFRTVIMLRVTMDALSWSSTQKNLWEALPEETEPKHHGKHSRRVRQYLHGSRTLLDQNFRAPILLSYNLKEQIMCHEKPLGYKLPVNEYRDLLRCVTEYMSAFHGFRVLVFTPYPFPLVQMTRIFIFFWVFSLPLVLIAQLNSLPHTCILIFFITFGFLGMEYVSMTLDDPFGSSPNDFDDEGMAEVVYEDVYAFLYKCDGNDSAAELRRRVVEKYAQGSALDNYRSEVLKDKFWERNTIV